MLATTLCISSIAGLAGSILLIIKSLYDFSQTGPAIKDEIRQSYRWYSCYAMMRLALWAGLIIFWMAITGILTISTYNYTENVPTTRADMLVAAFTGIFVISILQFCH